MKTQNIVILLILFSSLNIDSAFSAPIIQNYKHIPIDSLESCDCLGKTPRLHFKKGQIDIRYRDNRISPLREKISLTENSGVSWFVQESDSLYKIRISELISYTPDSINLSIYVILRGELPTIDTLSISRSQLDGISYIEYLDVEQKRGFSANIPKNTGFCAGIGINLTDEESPTKNYCTAELIYAIEQYYLIGYSYYAGSEFLFNKNKFLVAPKIGANLTILIGLLGCELVSITDFKNSTLIYRPYIGWGIGNMRISFGYNLHIYNKKEFDLSGGSFSLTLPFNLKKRIKRSNSPRFSEF